MEPLAALDSLMLAAEKLGSAMHVGVLLILSLPPDAGPDAGTGVWTDAGVDFVDELHRDSLIGPHDLDHGPRAGQ